jgi:RimJ/RimL family protein N-acetyltransferase
VSVFEPALPLETERLVFRAFTPEDLETLVRYQSDPEVTRYLMWGPRSRDEVRTSLDLKLASRSISAEGDALMLAAVRKDTDELVGEFMLNWVSEEHRLGEIGYIVHPDHQGQGYATEGNRLMLKLAFDGMALHRVIGRLEARNTASARVLEKLGMRLEAHLVENEFVKGEWQSELVYAMLAFEWTERNSDGRPAAGS